MDTRFLPLEYFYQVARHEGFSAAARKLRISQPSLSRAVKEAEDMLGVTLLERHRRGVRLTAAGQDVYERFDRILDQLQQLQASAKGQGRLSRGPIRIGASDTICNYLLPQVCERFTHLYPGVAFEIFSGTSEAIRQELLARRVDLAYFFTPVRERKIVAEKIGSVEFKAVTASRNRVRAQKAALPYVGSRKVDYAGPYPALKMLEHAGWSGDILMEANSLETQKRMVVAGLGFSVFPAFMVRSEIEDGRMIPVAFRKRLTADLFELTTQGFEPSGLHHEFSSQMKTVVESS
jgi:DNA-binding transcriptional LysR family regulator